MADNITAREEKMIAALRKIAFDRKHPTGGYLARTHLVQIARKVLLQIGFDWPARKGNEYDPSR